MSVSQIEEYASCAFRYFSSHVLRLEEREVFETDASETGTIAHKMMELSIKEYIEALSTVTIDSERERISGEFKKKNFRVWAEELFERACLETMNNVSADPALLISSGSRIKSMAEKSLEAVFGQIDSNGPVPEETEWRYGFGDVPPIRIRLPGSDREVLFRGIIDRVDIDHNKNLFSVLDYKTGDKKIDYRELYSGLSVQLPAYLYAYLSSHPGLMPASAGYFHLTSPVIAVKSMIRDEIDAEVSKERAKVFQVRSIDLDPEDLAITAKHAVLRIASHCEKLFGGEISAHPVFIRKKGENQVCSYCDYSAVCGIDPRCPPYAFPGILPDYTGDDGKKLKEKDRYIRAVREELGRKNASANQELPASGIDSGLWTGQNSVGADVELEEKGGDDLWS